HLIYRSSPYSIWILDLFIFLSVLQRCWCNRMTMVGFTQMISGIIPRSRRSTRKDAAHPIFLHNNNRSQDADDGYVTVNAGCQRKDTKDSDGESPF
ncbi:uncharacterized protein BYT42DRAFT_557393, partial [Radiomyces spectabilis]|uniref:uncharacterized protein n=1 Tax=Radiomyces spectabilis TaxID=64574 RepID=UPI0022211429